MANKVWKKFIVFGAILLISILAIAFWRGLHRRGQILQKLESEESYAEVALRDCLEGYQDDRDIHENWNSIRDCLGNRSRVRPFSVWYGRLGLYSSEEINNLAIRNRVIGDSDSVRLLNINVEGKWDGSYLVRKRVLWQLPSKKVEMNFEFIVDEGTLEGLK